MQEQQRGRLLLCEMNTLWQMIVKCRAHFPCVTDSLIGLTRVGPAPYYAEQGVGIEFEFSQPLDRDRIKDINRIGHWLNQNYVVRLCALLESHGVLSDKEKIRSDLCGSQELDLVRRLRNVFAHSAGRYKCDKSEHRRLLCTLCQVLHIPVSDCSDFPLGIAEVLEPLLRGCQRYVKAWAGLPE